MLTSDSAKNNIYVALHFEQGYESLGNTIFIFSLFLLIENLIILYGLRENRLLIMLENKYPNGLIKLKYN